MMFLGFKLCYGVGLEMLHFHSRIIGIQRVLSVPPPVSGRGLDMHVRDRQ